MLHIGVGRKQLQKLWLPGSSQLFDFSLDRAGLNPINRQEIVYMNEFETWTDEELQAEWERLQATN